MIISKENREDKLISVGVKSQFFQALRNLEELGDLQFQIQEPTGAYFYLEQLENQYEILKDYHITPICDGSNGDTFYVLLSKEDEVRFVYFGLEDDEIYEDFKDSFELLLAHLIIELMDFSEEQSSECFVEVATKLGLSKAKNIVDTINDLSEDIDIEVWKKEVLPEIIKSNM